LSRDAKFDGVVAWRGGRRGVERGEERRGKLRRGEERRREEEE
jgi:hypothetical protein